ncbi:GntR family transcriptional regulator [Burkholderia gladioli]|uniref:GntR family transcriptional regulator n=1 Tax=Burkholderia gladioli TaxID=28095 RepID=UPI001642BA0B|nr:GntR family transcriptional regulator [Burkholderia gladioli]
MASKLLRIPTRTDYVDAVYQALADAICDGTLAPGTRITQEEIAERLAVSRSPVLQALRLLKKDGLVQDAPGRGVLIAPLDAGWLSHLYEIRGTLDSLAARLATRRGARLDAGLLARGRLASSQGEVGAMIDADMAFHFGVYAASGNPLIGETARVHWVHLRRVMGAMLQVSGQRASIWDEHAAIAEAIDAGEAERAAQLSELHTHRAHAHLVAELWAVLEVEGAAP